MGLGEGVKVKERWENDGRGIESWASKYEKWGLVRGKKVRGYGNKG
jgi:hypothetical protein